MCSHTSSYSHTFIAVDDTDEDKDPNAVIINRTVLTPYQSPSTLHLTGWREFPSKRQRNAVNLWVMLVVIVTVYGFTLKLKQ